MKTIIQRCATFFVALSVMLAVAAVAKPLVQQDTNPFAGAWNANIEKSKRHPNHLFKSARLRFKISGEVVTLIYSGVNMSGVEESGTTSLMPDGKEHPLEAMPGAVEVSRWVGERALETVVTKDGKVIGQSNYALSADGKTLTATLKGIDASGAFFEQTIVFDRE